MDKENVVHIYNGILLNHKKWNSVIFSYMDKPRGCHSKQSYPEKDKYIISFTCGIQKKKDTNDLIYKIEIDPET